MKLTLLGTGAALVTRCFNTSFILHEDDWSLLVDGGGGNGILRRLEETGFDWKGLRHIFVTHKHLDHLMGILWMIRMICQNMDGGSYEGEAFLYSHEEVIALLREYTHQLLPASQAAFLDARLHMIPVSDGELLSISGKTLQVFDIHSTKARQFGFTLPLSDGRRLSCCGDEPYKPHEERYVRGSDWLLHEAFCLHTQADLFHPYEKHHATVKDACETAQALGIKNLVLYHTEEKNLARRRQLYTAEGALYFSGNLFVPEDGETLDL